jgi:hypothetical protein
MLLKSYDSNILPLNQPYFQSTQANGPEVSSSQEYYSQHNKTKIIFPDTFQLTHVNFSAV